MTNLSASDPPQPFRILVICTGTRSPQGIDAKMTLASVFGTWRARGLNTLTTTRRQLLAAPQA